jgi:hypothetical protein
MGISDRTAWKLRSFNRRRARFGEDLCSIKTFTSTPDGFGGTTEVETIVASGIKCFIEGPSSPSEYQIGGAALTTLPHTIIMEATAATKAIKSDYLIVVAPRNDKGALTFERPITLDGSYTPLVQVAAVLAE